MAHPRRTLPAPSRAVALALGLGLSALPLVASAAPDDDEDYDEDLGDDDEDLGDDDEDLGDDEGPTDDEEAPGASASGSASVSLGGGAKAKGKAKRDKKGKKDKKPKGEKTKDDRPFFQRYKPTNHMLNVGVYFGGFFRGSNHGLFDRAIGTQPSIRAGNPDLGFRFEYLPIPYVGVGFEAGGMPTVSSSEMGAKGGFYTVRGHLVGSLPYRLTPTLAVGGGLIGLRSKNAAILNGGDGAFHWGPGVKFHINEWIAVRLDGRHIVTGANTSIDSRRVNHGEILVGAEVTLRLTKWVGADYRAQRSDRDGDEVADYWDECPDEYGEGEDGCPRNRDSDNDGMPDRSDRCPNEWGDGPDGCPIPDKDGDGILDLNDSCEDKPENYNGIEDQDGCPDELPEELKQFEGVLEGIQFDTGKATIRKRSLRPLDKVADILEKYEGIKVEISGHTDDVGSHDDNMQLSQERADAVKNYLVSKGIDESRIRTRGAGPDEPIADNKSKTGRAKNRRIEFKVQ